MPQPGDQVFIRQMRKKVEQELVKKEIEILEYWRGELDKVLKRRHQGLAALSNDLKILIGRMDKRRSVL